MRYMVTAAAGFALLASSVPASAQMMSPGTVDWHGPHVGLSIGGEWSRLSDSVSVAPTPAGVVPGSAAVPGSGTSLRSPHRGNVTGGGQVGYDWQLNNFVFGVEGDIRGGGPSVSTTIGGATPNLAVGDNFKADSDFNASVRGRLGYAWNQYLFYGTGGVAFADAHVRANYAATTIGGVAVPGGSASGSTTLIGPTVGGGIEYAVSPNVSVGGEYRYTDYGDDTVSLGRVPTAAGAGAGAGAVATAPATARLALRDNTLLFKVNYRFGAPPPAPLPAAAPAPPPPAAPRVFIVFFDWDRDTVTPEGQQIVRQAAAAYRTGAPVQIQVTGYTDRSGSPAYNQRLSERRANNVAQALVALGVPQTQMLVSGRGENANRVPTADGVREPQNRRVEITAP